MGDLFSVITDYLSKDISGEQALAEVSGWDRIDIDKHLEAAGLDLNKTPSNKNIRADILLKIHLSGLRAQRVREQKTVQKFVSGTVFDTDPVDMKGRFSTKKDDELVVWSLYVPIDSDPRIEKDLLFSKTNLPHDLWEEIPDEAEGLAPPDAPQIGPPIIEIVDRQYIRVDIKLVYWIPFRANEFPVPRKMLPAGWRGIAMTQESRLAARSMLSTGNPTPRDSFTEAQWDALVASKEYRGLLYRELFCCCPNELSKQDIEKLTKVGFTPPSSNAADASRLQDDRKDKQNIGSIVAGGLATDDSVMYAMAPPGAAVPDHVEDALELIHEMGLTNSNETYSEGEELLDTQRIAGCHSGSWDFTIRVGKVHNLLNNALTGQLISYQGGLLTWKLCCDTSDLKLTYNHSAIPSQRIYVNNQVVYDYDMLTAPWAQVAGSFFTAPDENWQGSKEDLKDALESNTKAPRPITKTITIPLTLEDGCPSPPPSDWIPPSSG